MGELPLSVYSFAHMLWTLMIRFCIKQHDTYLHKQLFSAIALLSRNSQVTDLSFFFSENLFFIY